MQAATSLATSNLRWHRTSLIFKPTSASDLHPKISHCCSSPILVPSPLLSRQQQQVIYTTRKERNWRKSHHGPLKASSADDPSVDSSEKWLLEPAGDGDSRHIGFKVPMPGAFEIVSDVVTVGRVPDKASLVIPVATVSGLHARLEKKEGRLLVTDLYSTNGTYVDEMKLKPSVAVNVSPGSSITFGDPHLAMFRVSKLIDEVSGEKSDLQNEAVVDVTVPVEKESVM